MGKLKGGNPPAVTIFDCYGQVDYFAMKRHADFMIERGVKGIAYLGTSGEFGVMTLEQKLELIDVMTSYVDGRVNVLIGVGDTCLENTKLLIDAAEQAKADAVLVVAPYFSVYAEQNIETYYQKVSELSSLPVIIYNFPALTGFDMTPTLVTRLALSCDNIIGIKDTVPEVGHLREMLKIKDVKPEFCVFCAYETQAKEMILEGIDGFINATANFVPQFTAGLCKAAEDKNEAEIDSYYNKMCKAGEVYQYAEPLLLAVKEAVYQQVICYSGAEILPGLSLPEENKLAIKKLMEELEKGGI